MLPSNFIQLACILSSIGGAISRPQYSLYADSEEPQENLHSLAAPAVSNAELAPPPPSNPLVPGKEAKPVVATPVPKPEPPPGAEKKDGSPEKDAKIDGAPGKPTDPPQPLGPTAPGPGTPGKNGGPAGEPIGKDASPLEETAPKPKGKNASSPLPLIEAKPPPLSEDPARKKPEPKKPIVPQPPSGDKKSGNKDDWVR
ncbi:hypothetical protein PTTG_03812 [Puccinia triticina 1-1 BBBD Race 1]|uniref:Uncharacterized protein n=2 Tax=Puccinia triticina TaxID=208348 RepID=A0A0C4ESN3_PUCT1|nr:uncharacterized protein PtA15_5A144 [Puccinia triticina]OAV94599.1 hypothetical protein PTTG_03812 [Puccinia triticina 1-1 BBBD Race 1]WAQ84574.1 hypothetical protein PtA15_5A144 [Puccinia triticina]